MKKIDNNKKMICFLTSFSTLNATYNTHKAFIEYMSKKYDHFYIFNFDNMIFFPTQKKYEFSDLINRRPKNIIIKDINNKEEFLKIADENKLIVFLNMGRSFKEMKVFLSLKNNNIKLFKVSNIGSVQRSQLKNTKKKFFHTILYFLNNVVSPRLVTILSNLKLTPKLEVRFLSNKKYFDSIKKNKIKNFLYEKKLLYQKKIILVNSQSNDLLNMQQNEISEKYIVHLDYDLNYGHSTDMRGRFSDEIVEKHYFSLNKFLTNLSTKFNKEIKVCIHPLYNQNLIQEKLKNFEVIKYKTRDYILKSYLVTFFESSSIVEAILLKKKILNIKSNFLGNNSIYSEKFGIESFNFTENSDFNKTDLLQTMENQIKNYSEIVDNYHFLDKKNLYGLEKIYKTINEEY